MRHVSVQVADLNRGAFGFVQLAKDVTTGEQVAIKFIERGDKARWQSHENLLMERPLQYCSMAQIDITALSLDFCLLCGCQALSSSIDLGKEAWSIS